MRTIDLSTLNRLFGMAEADVLRWITDFNEHFSQAAKGMSWGDRCFTTADLCVLLYIQSQTEDGNGPDEIEGGLCCCEHLNDILVEEARLHTPIFQEVPDNIEETWQGVLIGGMAGRDWIQVARSYKLAADSLLVEALKSDEPHLYDYPIYYLYRHCLELYLKTIIGDTIRSHDFENLVKVLEVKCHKTLGGWIRERLWDFHEIDQKSVMFRYPEFVNSGELWIDFHHLRFIVDCMIQLFEQHISDEK